ncbi:MAG: radical SAM protein [Candidatus Aminicenantes bacterium]|nr:radical SAM protein [Candidatus Aminicenantes bacterium]NIM80014.1 radical SAM protein [Candidatus Aminicenantes bacterium]NIN19368.1 radical SAM protein [Candidatus Aminicenantes bacterium]NIN43267.1 radical SAM protein [Candidatus Aminicenantes bacterium]NIN86009.1 radical SAM protein [Candidatus Aminicenantes bacterium]
MRAESRYGKEKQIYAREFHTVKDNETIVTYDVENTRLIQLDDLEACVLKSITEKPASMPELKKRLPDENGDKIEEAVNELINVDMLGYSPFKNISPKKIAEFERRRLKSMKKKEFKQIALNVTHRCNMNCDYCYGGDGSYGGPAIDMSRDTARQAVDFLMKESGDSDFCRITLFGGEPLLNFELVKYVVQYARKEASKCNKKIHFGMTTNGILLDDDKIDFLVKENIELTFSIDGPKDIHDKSRPFKSNKEKSSYDLVYPKIARYIEKAEVNNCHYGLRATVTRPTILNMCDVIDFFRRFKTKSIIFDVAEYRNGISPSNLAISNDDLSVYRNQLKKMAEKYKEDRLKCEYDFFAGPLKEMKNKTRKESHCVSPGIHYVGISAEGDIFPCHRFVGYKETKLGNVWQGFHREKWLEKYAKVHLYNSTVCTNCWVRYFCGGLCPATQYYLGGDMVLSEKIEQEPVHCQLKKIVFEESMLLFARLSEEELEVVDCLDTQKCQSLALT